MCGKNEGHLIRIVGPAFEMVCGWAEQGVPLKVACRGIDRFCERYYAKGPRRRPVRIEFCEADVLDAFDDWRRAIGVPSASFGGDVRRTNAGGEASEPPPRKPALAAHIDRVIARLTALRGGGRGSSAFETRLAEAVRELDGLAGGAKHARGGARSAILERLAALDGELVRAAITELDDGARAGLRAEAEQELAPFGDRLAPDVRAAAVDAAFERLVRETLGLPVVTFD